MKVYAEFKRCAKTLDCDSLGYDFIHNPACFIDGKAIFDSGLYISKDYKYAYRYFRFSKSIYRITNISSKPIVEKYDKLTAWKNIQKQIDELKTEQKKLLHKKKGINLI